MIGDWIAPKIYTLYEINLYRTSKYWPRKITHCMQPSRSLALYKINIWDINLIAQVMKTLSQIWQPNSQDFQLIFPQGFVKSIFGNCKILEDLSKWKSSLWGLSSPTLSTGFENPHSCGFTHWHQLLLVCTNTHRYWCEILTCTNSHWGMLKYVAVRFSNPRIPQLLPNVPYLYMECVNIWLRNEISIPTKHER